MARVRPDLSELNRSRAGQPAQNTTNLIGEVFGRLTVLAQAKSKHNRARWVCQCKCGKRCEAVGKTLREGRKQSCGCLKREASQEAARKSHIANTLPDGVASCNALYATYQWNAESRGRLFTLTIEEFRKMTSSNCFYCGRVPKQIIATSSCKTPYIYNGIDRQDNSKGYVTENCVPCCGVCNDMKRARTVQEFIVACEAVISYQKTLEIRP